MSEERKIIQFPTPTAPSESSSQPVNIIDPSLYSRHKVNHYLVVGVGEDNFGAAIKTVEQFLRAEGLMSLEMIANGLQQLGYQVNYGETGANLKEEMLRRIHDFGVTSDENVYVAYQLRKAPVDYSHQLTGKTENALQVVSQTVEMSISENDQEETDKVLEGIAIVKLQLPKLEQPSIQPQNENVQVSSPVGEENLADNPYLRPLPNKKAA